MPSPSSFIKLHLECRLWIAELNSDINTLRIYNDYLEQIAEGGERADLRAECLRYQQLLPNFREQIDVLRNDMHLLKMKFASFAREQKAFDAALYEATDHKEVKKRFKIFRKSFDEFIQELDSLEQVSST